MKANENTTISHFTNWIEQRGWRRIVSIERWAGVEGLGYNIYAFRWLLVGLKLNSWNGHGYISWVQFL